METTTRDRRVEDAKASLVARLEELGRRIRAARVQLDIPARIAAHPLVAVGVAFALGAVLGGIGRRTRVPDAEVKRGLGGAIVAALGAFAVGALKDFAMHQVSGAASQWFERGTEDETSRAAELQ